MKHGKPLNAVKAALDPAGYGAPTGAFGALLGHHQASWVWMWNRQTARHRGFGNFWYELVSMFLIDFHIFFPGYLWASPCHNTKISFILCLLLLLLSPIL